MEHLHTFIKKIIVVTTSIAFAGNYFPIGLLILGSCNSKGCTDIKTPASSFHTHSAKGTSLNRGNAGEKDMPMLPPDANSPSGVTAPGDAFILQAMATANPNTPEVAEWIKQAGPDDHISLTGHMLNGAGTEARVYNGHYYSAVIPQMDAESGQVRMPAELSGFGMYVMWLRNANGYGTPVTINKTTALWMQKVATPGMTVFLIGKNLAHGNREGTANSHIYLKPQSGAAGKFAAVTKVNPYRVEFTMPQGLASGNYDVWAHNGYGGDYGWSEKLSITVVGVQDHVKTRNFGSRYPITAYGAVAGNTEVDNAPCINAAAAAASAAGGGIVYIPAGTYTVRHYLDVYENVKYQGETAAKGTPASIIKLAGPFTPSFHGFYGDPQKIRNMIMWENIVLDNTAGINTGGNGGSFMVLGNPTMMFWKNCQVLCKGYQPVRMSNQASNVYFENVKFVGKEIFLEGTGDTYFDRCDFKMTNASEGALMPWSVKRFSVTNSRCSDYDTSITGQGTRFIFGNSLYGSSYDQYFERNTITGVGAQLTGGGDRNRGETFLWEAAQTKHTSLTSSATATTVTLSVAPSLSMAPAGSHVTIGKGTGMGQTRMVTANNGKGLITIDRPWNVIPDASSLCLTGEVTRDMILYKNVIDARSKPYLVSADLSKVTASAGVNFFAGCIGNVFDGNTVMGTRTGIANMATEYAPPLYHPNMFNLFQNNIISGTRWGLLIQAYPEQDEWIMPGTGILCTVYRNNTLSNISSDQVYYGVVRDRAYPQPSISNIIFEHSRMDTTPPRNLLRSDWGYPPSAVYPGTVTLQLFYANAPTGSRKVK